MVTEGGACSGGGAAPSSDPILSFGLGLGLQALSQGSYASAWTIYTSSWTAPVPYLRGSSLQPGLAFPNTVPPYPCRGPSPNHPIPPPAPRVLLDPLASLPLSLRLELTSYPASSKPHYLPIHPSPLSFTQGWAEGPILLFPFSGSMAEKSEEWSTQLSYLVLGVVSLHSAVHTARVNRGAAAGFLLQALAAAAALAPGPQPDINNQMGTWVATVIGLPLLAFDFHWVNGDRSTANLLLGGGMVLAVAGDYLGTETKAVAGQAVALVAAVTILIVSVFTVNTYGMGGGVALGAAGLMSRLEEETLLLFFQREDACRWALAVGSWAYRWALHTQHLELD